MTKSIILSTGNIVSGGPSIIRKNGASRSNLELTASLRSNFQAAKEEYAPTPDGSENGTGNGHSVESCNGNSSATIVTTPKLEAPLCDWTEQQEDTLYVPRINWDFAGLQEEPARYDVTAKLFFLTTGSPSASPAQREQHTREALSLVLKELRIPGVDLLVVSFPGMSFDGDCEWEADKQNARQGEDEEEAAAWPAFEQLQREGLVRNLGIAEFGSEKLARLLRRVEIKPAVDQINIKNCCNVPPPLVELATKEGIDLLVHNDSTDVLPKGTLRELLGSKGAGVLVDRDAAGEGGLKGDLTPQWVIKYTAVVRDRGVIENKGYFAGADLDEDA